MKLEVSGLAKRFGKTHALDGLSLSVESARVLVFIGPSGGGKSTLLRVLGGLETADSGVVSINFRPLPADPAGLQAYRRKNGFLFQQFNLFPHLTARRNIELPLEKVHAHTPAEAHTMAEQALDRFGLLDHADKLPAQLSGGQQQQLAIGRALVIRPKLLVLDEPTEGIQPSIIKDISRSLREIRDLKKLTIVVSEQVLSFVLDTCDRIMVIDKGKLIREDNRADVDADQIKAMLSV